MGWGQLVKLNNAVGQRILCTVAHDECMQHMEKWKDLSLPQGGGTENYVESKDSGGCFFKPSSWKVKVVRPYDDGSGGSDTIGYFGKPSNLMPTLLEITSHTELGLMLVATDVHISDGDYLVVSLTAQGCKPNPDGPSTVQVDGNHPG